jgi:GTPase SAR1 family protein
MAKLLCPYCFESFRRAEIAFRCINPHPNRCPLEEDKELGNYRGFVSPPSLPRVFRPPSRFFGVSRSAVCSCGKETRKTVCPHCHNELPYQFWSQTGYTIALIGAKESGKSNYIAVLIDELNRRVGENLGTSLSAVGEDTIERYKRDFYHYVYVRGEVVDATRSARAEIKTRSPLIYRFSRGRDGLQNTIWKAARAVGADGVLGINKPLRSTSLVFFDTAGEDLTHIDVMSTETKYIANSDGLIFLLDPLQIPSVRHTLSGSVPLPYENTEPMEIITRVTDLIRGSQELEPDTRIKTPVALAFSKIDAVQPLIDPESPIHRASRHDGFFDISDAEAVNENMRAYVAEWVGKELDRFMQYNYETYYYFGLSALGSPPEDNRLPVGITPFRVEDPLLWILHRLKIIPGRRSQQ